MIARSAPCGVCRFSLLERVHCRGGRRTLRFRPRHHFEVGGELNQAAPDRIERLAVALKLRISGSNQVVERSRAAQEDGTALYGSEIATAKVNPKREVELPAGRPAILDCYGKTLDQLRATGRVIEFKPTQ